MERLKHIYINNNRLSKIEKGLARNVPNLESLIMQNNMFEELEDITPLSEFQSLKFLSLVGNPVAKKPAYRQAVIKMLPQLKVLDFLKVKPSEREESAEKGSKKQKVNVFEPGKPIQVAPKRDPKEIAKIKVRRHKKVGYYCFVYNPFYFTYRLRLKMQRPWMKSPSWKDCLGIDT